MQSRRHGHRLAAGRRPAAKRANPTGRAYDNAEVFAQIHGGGTDTVTPNFMGAFPRVTRAVRQLLR
jgi:hypothetical protein